MSAYYINANFKQNVRCLCLLNPCYHRLGQTSKIDLHLIATASGAGGPDRNLGQRFTGLVSLLCQSCDNSDGGIVLVERRTELLPRLRQGLSQCVCFQS